MEERYLFYDGESVAGEVLLTLKKPGQKLEHQGIRIEFVGQIGKNCFGFFYDARFVEVYYDRGNQHDFICLSKELARPGELTQNAKFPFCFAHVSKPYESFIGTNVKLR